MPAAPRPARGTIELLLATVVLLIAVIAVTDVPRPYPTWPAIGTIPVTPELVVPGLLGLVVLPGIRADGPTVGSIGIAGLGLVTLWLATTSLYSLYTGAAGGVFWGGLYTLVSGVVLAAAVIVRGAWRRGVRRGIARHLRNRSPE